METKSYLQAATWVQEGYDIALEGDHFVKKGWVASLLGGIPLVSPRQREVRAILQSLYLKIIDPTQQQKGEYLALADAVIKRYQASNSSLQKITRLFDRAFAPHQEGHGYSHSDNIRGEKKWVQQQLPLEIFRKYPGFFDYLDSTKLLSQIKVTRDTVIEQRGEPCLLVNGSWMTFSDLKRNFELVDAPRYGEKFMVKKLSRDVYTYLDNGKGLQKHHPYMTEFTPISTLNEADYQRTLDKALQFVRSAETPQERKEKQEERSCIVQIVSSYVTGPDTNATELLQQRKHPYIRIIVGKDNAELGTKKGDVYEVGYGWKNKTLLPFVTSNGQFRSPDRWEYMPCQQKLVTNIAISQKEANTLLRYTQKYHRDGINLGKETAFHLVHQNCSVYVRSVLNSIDIDIPTEINLNSLIGRIAPNWLKGVAAAFSKGVKEASRLAGRGFGWLPSSVKNGFTAVVSKVQQCAARVLQVFIASIVVPLRAMGGDGFGEGGEAFVAPGEQAGQIEPPLFDWKNAFRLSNYKVNLPGILQEWQRQQPSTVVYDNPIRLAIVP